MQPTVLFIESNKGGHVLSGIAAARRLGVRSHFICRNPAEYEALPVTPMQLADGWTQAETFDPASLYAAGAAVAATSDVVGVAAFDDYRVIPAVTLATQLGVNPTLTVSGVLTARNKHSMREALSASRLGVRFATGHVDEVTSSPIGYPCVVKPVNETGSASVRLCTDDAQFTAARRAIGGRASRVNSRGFQPEAHLLVEEMLLGPEFSAEMAWSHPDGQWVLLGVTEKHVIHRDAIIEAGHAFPYPLGDEERASVVADLRHALDVVGLAGTYAHVEFIMTARGLRIVEINARPGGGSIAELMQRSCGVDPFAAHVAAHCGLPLPEPTGGVGAAAIRFVVPPRAGVLTGIDARAEAPGEVQYRFAATPFDVVAVDSNDYRAGSVVACAATYADAIRLADDAISAVDLTYGNHVTEAAPAPPTIIA